MSSFFRGDDGMCLVSLASLGVSMFGLGGWRGFSMMVCALDELFLPDGGTSGASAIDTGSL